MLKDKNLNNAEQGHKKTPSPWRLIAPTLLSLGLCVVCLFGATWAWFTARVDGNVASIQAASFTVDVQVVDSAATTDNAAPLPSVNQDGMDFSLTANTTYQVTLTANGTAKTGYCMVSLNDQSHPTVALASGTTLTFRVSSDSDSKLSFEARWGVYKTNGTESLLTDGCLLTPNGIAANGVIATEDVPATTEPTTEPSVTETTEAVIGTTVPSEAATEAPTLAPTQPEMTAQPSESPVPATTEAASPAD